MIDYGCTHAHAHAPHTSTHWPPAPSPATFMIQPTQASRELSEHRSRAVTTCAHDTGERHPVAGERVGILLRIRSNQSPTGPPGRADAAASQWAACGPTRAPCPRPWVAAAKPRRLVHLSCPSSSAPETRDECHALPNPEQHRCLQNRQTPCCRVESYRYITFFELYGRYATADVESECR